MSTTIDVHELAARLDEAVRLASEGREVLVSDGGTPRARLTPVAPPSGPRIPGLHRGAMEMAADFDATLPDDFWLGRL